MQTAFDVIKDTYDYEQCKEIVNHGCQSGVCSQHVYYADTISFFETYEDEIIEFLADACGGEINEELWLNNTCNYTGYQNDTVWAFIEFVAALVVDEKEEQELSDDQTIEGYNPARSMTETRYAQV